MTKPKRLLAVLLTATLLAFALISLTPPPDRESR